MHCESENIANQEIALLLLLSKGDNEAFHTVFTNYFPRVKQFIFSIIRSKSAAEDLSQDIFVKVWEHRETLTAIQSFNAYIYAMARNAALNYTRMKINHSSFLDDAVIQDTTVSIEEEYYAHEKELLIRLVVENMPSQRRKVFEMSRFEGLQNDEIAEKLQISKRTVENHLSSAMREIKQTLLFFALLLLHNQ